MYFVVVMWHFSISREINLFKGDKTPAGLRDL